MTFAENQRQVEAAAAELSRAATDAVGRTGGFDAADSLKRLAQAAAKLSAALGEAQEAQQVVDRLLAT